MKIDGIVILNKPTGISSMKAVNLVQKKLGADKIGNLGTLDPLASGVLVVALGNATKLFQKHLEERKIYRTIFKFGVETESFDADGKITVENDNLISIDKVKEQCKSMCGKIAQIPPKFSAKKINGKKAYELARETCEFELKPKNVEIFRFELIEQVDINTFMFDIECSSGTYVRSCCRDLAHKLGTVGFTAMIIRLQSGQYKIQDAVTINEIDFNCVIKLGGNNE